MMRQSEGYLTVFMFAIFSRQNVRDINKKRITVYRYIVTRLHDD
jgi:hypothetical protein